MKILLVVGAFLQIWGAYALIIPDELPSLLSVIYSNIPTIKKGTDSRVGWGFRLGNRADFQVLVEIGPQLNTQPIRRVPASGSSKRNIVNNLSNTLYAQQQYNKKVTKQGEGTKWIDQWRNTMQTVTEQKQEIPVGAKPGLALGEVDAKSVIPDDTTLMLQKLYQANKETKPKDQP
ncbi:hypothetical protein RN001_010583 [Aquatica leii]|uniref:Secreted protein n=1 Tax=Aquatica leii TaxID=1421715 RepID=A0AAN7PWJ4_9COLE|nr:hypothetical protein RN001_010583 [Aquatica leii]